MNRSSRLLQLLRAAPSYQASQLPYEDRGVADLEPFPFLAIVGQAEMKLALVLTVLNPAIGGVLLIGSRGTAKTTAVRSLLDLLPTALESLCPNNQGCTEARLADEGMAGICVDCATRYGYGEPLSRERKARIIELPLNARLEDVVGGIDERIVLERQRVQLERGLLARADNNVLYIDEVNLLVPTISDAILDAAAQGHYTVWRGPQKLTYNSRFILIGSMNPEEGPLRPQIMDRFGLRVLVRGLTDAAERFLVYELVRQYQTDPEALAGAYAEATLALAQEIQQARARLPQVAVSDAARSLGLELVAGLKVDSHRAELTLFEAARAHAAAADRPEATPDDIRAVALPALRLRQGEAMAAFLAAQADEDARIAALLDSHSP